jgi:DNA-binding NarL/FixJ family response regulator
MKILVVDDHPLIREALRGVLRDLDPKINLIEAESVHEALVLVATHPDLRLLLLDLGLPGENGLDALPLLRENHPHLPVVVLSASEQPGIVTRAIDAGAMGYIPKTSSRKLLVDSLRRVISGGVYLPEDALLAHGGGVPGFGRLKIDGRPPSLHELGLSERQGQVLALMVQGKPNKMIGRELNLAEGTIKIHVAGILKILKVANRTQAVFAVSTLGLRLPSLVSDALSVH